jgi:hypothetical protein
VAFPCLSLNTQEVAVQTKTTTSEMEEMNSCSYPGKKIPETINLSLTPITMCPSSVYHVHARIFHRCNRQTIFRKELVLHMQRVKGISVNGQGLSLSLGDDGNLSRRSQRYIEPPCQMLCCLLYWVSCSPCHRIPTLSFPPVLFHASFLRRYYKSVPDSILVKLDHASPCSLYRMQSLRLKVVGIVLFY